MDKSGNIKAAVIGVGGLLGVGEQLVAVPFDKVKFVNEPVAYTASTATNTPAPAGRHDDDTGSATHRTGHGDRTQSVVPGPRGVQRHQG